MSPIVHWEPTFFREKVLFVLSRSAGGGCLLRGAIMNDPEATYGVAVIGGGIAGMATALRLQAAGLSTIVFEAHGQPGGCAGFFRRRGFAFDVGATTLVDFAPGGVGGELLSSVGLPPPPGEALPGYLAWLPDRTVTLHRDPGRWAAERL